MSPDDLDPSPPVAPAPDPRWLFVEDEYEPPSRLPRRGLELDYVSDVELLYGGEPSEEEILWSRRTR